MRVGVIVSLGASALLGLSALVVAKTVLPHTAAAKVPALAPRPATGVAVVVAARSLKFGDKLAADQLKIVHMPPEAAPQGYFSTIEAVLSQDGGGAPVALTPIAEHEALLPAKLSGPGARPSVAAEIADGMRAFTIGVSDVSGVGGHALPGDRVDVVLTRDLTPNGDRRTFVSSVIVQNVRVLAVDLNADLTSNKPASPTTATLEVGVPDSQELAAGSEVGKLSLALRRTGATDAVAVSAPVLPVAAPRVVRPRPAAAPPAEGGGLILIVEGDGSGEGRSRRSAPRPAPAPAPAPAPTASAGAPAKSPLA